MKKTTILVLACFVALITNAQSTSFEGAEGFALGAIDGQNGWTVFASIPAGPQITNSDATDGTFSLQVVDDAVAADGTLNGAFSPTFASIGDVTLTVDVHAGPTGLSDVDVVTQSPSQMLLTTRVKFQFDDVILVLDDPGGGVAFQDTGATVPRGTWFELTIEHRFSTGEILYYIDGGLIYTGTIFGATNVEQMIFLTDNFGSDGFFDNVQYMDDTLSLSEASLSENISVFPNPTQSDLNVKFSGNFGETKVEIVSVTGQTVLRTSIDGFGLNSIPTNGLADGVYFARLSSESGNASIKFVKN